MRALRALTIANVRSFVRDRAALFWTLAFPLIFIFLFGFIFQGSGGAGLDVAWADEDASPASAQLRAAFAAADGVDVTDQDRAAGIASMQDGKVDTVIVIPAGYGAGLAAAGSGTGAPAQIEVYTDPSRQQLQGSVYQVVGSVLGVVNLGGRPPMVVPIPQTVQTENLNFDQLLRAEHPRAVGHAGRHLRGDPAGRRPREADPQAAGGHPASALAARRVQRPDAAADRAGPDGHHRRGGQRVLRRRRSAARFCWRRCSWPSAPSPSSRWATSSPRSPGPKRRPTASPRSSSSR